MCVGETFDNSSAAGGVSHTNGGSLTSRRRAATYTVVVQDMATGLERSRESSELFSEMNLLILRRRGQIIHRFKSAQVAVQATAVQCAGSGSRGAAGVELVCIVSCMFMALFALCFECVSSRWTDV